MRATRREKKKKSAPFLLQRGYCRSNSITFSLISLLLILPLSTTLASTTIAVIFNVDVNRIVKVAAKLFRFFLSKGVSGNHCRGVRQLCKRSVLFLSILTLKSLIDVDGLLSTRLKIGNVTLGLAKGHGSLVGNL